MPFVKAQGQCPFTVPCLGLQQFPTTQGTICSSNTKLLALSVFFDTAQENTFYGATTEICCAREPFWRLQRATEMSMQELPLKFPNSGLLHALGKVQQCFKLIVGIQEH